MLSWNLVLNSNQYLRIKRRKDEELFLTRLFKSIDSVNFRGWNSYWRCWQGKWFLSREPSVHPAYWLHLEQAPALRIHCWSFCFPPLLPPALRWTSSKTRRESNFVVLPLVFWKTDFTLVSNGPYLCVYPVPYFLFITRWKPSRCSLL